MTQRINHEYNCVICESSGKLGSHRDWCVTWGDPSGLGERRYLMRLRKYCRSLPQGSQPPVILYWVPVPPTFVINPNC